MYEFEIADSLTKLKNIVENQRYSHDRALNFLAEEDLLDDQFRREEVRLIQNEFMIAAETYLKTHHPGKFIMFRDWCVHICTVEFQAKHLEGLSHYWAC